MTDAISLLLAILTAATQFSVVGLVLVFAASRVFAHARGLLSVLVDAMAPAGLWMAWTVAVVATAGSLYYSEAAGYTPCDLCWYQRIAIYPMVVLLGVAAVRRDTSIALYAAPLALAGAVISAYHYQLQRLPSQASEFCDPLNPCSFTWVWELGYVSIPMMAMTAGIVIAMLVTLAHVGLNRELQGDIDAIEI